MSDHKETYGELYHELMGEMEEFHHANQRRLRRGLRSLLLVPMIFLVLLFLTDGSRVLFLLAWITSMFIISAYLIAVEYLDDEMQKRLGRMMNVNKQKDLLASEREERRHMLQERLQHMQAELHSLRTQDTPAAEEEDQK